MSGLSCAVMVGPMCFRAVTDLYVMLACMLIPILGALAFALAVRRRERRRRD